MTPEAKASTSLDSGRDALITEQAAATILSIQTSTLQNWRWQGVGPRFYKVGGRLVRYRRADLEAWLSNCAHENPKGAA